MGCLKQLAADVAWTLVPFLVLGVLWEIVARSGIYPPKLFPSLVTVFDALLRLTVSGIASSAANGSSMSNTAGL